MNMHVNIPFPTTEGLVMPAIVDFPAVVQEALARFGDLFANEPERRHFGEYLTGLIVADRKNVSAISREFAVTTDQSCLNRWLTEVDWDPAELNRRRLQWMQEDASTRYSEHGVIAIDNVLIDHDGKMIQDVGWFWDHAQGRHKIAHDYLIANYVCTSGKHYPLDFHRFVQRTACELKQAAFRDHNELFRELVDWIIEQHIPGAIVFDSWFTHAANLDYIHARRRSYVGDLKFNRRLIVAGQEIKADAFAATIPPSDRKPVTIGEHKQWYFTKTVKIPDLDHKVRIVILWKERSSESPSKILVSNEIQWDVTRILRVYKHRWTGTECFHRDGKQHLGMGDCQLRKAEGQTRHLYLVFTAYSALMRQMEQGRARAWALERLTTIGQACRAVLKQTLVRTIQWIIEQVQDVGLSFQQIKVRLALG